MEPGADATHAERVPDYRPQLAQAADEAPSGNGWLHEIKYDGYRIGCALEHGSVRLVSRSGNDWTDRFAEIARALVRLPARAVLLDGEAAVVDEEGRTSFQALQTSFDGALRAGLRYFAFDLLWLDGRSLAPRPLDERKALLSGLLRTAPSPILHAPFWIGRGPEVLREACRLRLEGIVSKRRDAPYREGRGPSWRKVKCVLRREFVVCGFTPSRNPVLPLGALLVALHDRTGALRFAGRVGTGFTHSAARALRARLDSLAVDSCPLSEPPPRELVRVARWVRPVLVCEAAYTEWTRDGRLREPSFLGLREDKPASDVGPED